MGKFGYLSALLVLALLMAYSLWQLQPSRMNKLGRNSWVGMRSDATTRSDAAWLAAHKSSWPLSKIAGTVGIAVVLSAALAILVVPPSAVEPVAAVAIIGGIATYTALLVFAFIRAQKAAERVNRNKD
ncbi:SdpI family protein [Kineococcus sp. LSe6-4]|uniref:SdpI family protein n=1 Tax=Kineococcus halophytocola TaxID=3234027 RepID=A0ABV4H613_9ACTN